MLAQKLLAAAPGLVVPGGGGGPFNESLGTYFKSALRTGTGAAGVTVTGKPDLPTLGGMIIHKSRNFATAWRQWDTIQGAQKYLAFNSTAVQNATNDPTFASINSDGFTLSDGDVTANRSPDPFLDLVIARHPRLFNFFTYTGTGAVRTLAHGLDSSVSVGMFIAKRYLTTTGAWAVYHRGLTATQFGTLANDTSTVSSAYWNNTEPDSTNITLGTNAAVNASSGSYMGLVFAHDPASDGVIQCGTATLDANGLATVNLGWRPQTVLYMTEDGASNWCLVDVHAGWTFSSTYEFTMNSSGDVFIKSNYIVTATSTGLSIVRDSSWANRKIHFVAFREEA